MDAAPDHETNAASGSRSTDPNLMLNGDEGSQLSGCPADFPPFQPYIAKNPWHAGPRAAACRLFPKYGNYCGPNFSSGREGGSPAWDVPPQDSLDYCCYRHDMGYDSKEQQDLLQADISLLQCLHLHPRHHELAVAGRAYRQICIFGA
eukprot:TRINITY_DN15778_c0_g1_i1.p2 TRINITY_DN15778_c0_g1~~TRINITY_DN15778_c0_g1_i1.p2  ORF type:complete len:148 (-),score=20.09 TRINITY_DN15778_c0_g1_i1:100-543(-)